MKLPLRFTLIQPPLLLRLGLLGSSLKQLCPNKDQDLPVYLDREVERQTGRRC